MKYFSFYPKILVLIAALLMLSSQLKADEGMKIMLLKEYSEDLIDDSAINDYLISEKLDGVRAIWDGKNLRTKNNIIINAPTCWLKDFPSFNLDGELWTKRDDFDNISRLVRQKTPSCESWSNMKYCVFDVPPNNSAKENIKENSRLNPQFSNACSLLNRLDKLKKYLTIHKNTTIKIIEQKRIKSKQDIKDSLDSLTKEGAEGLVIRRNSAPYTSGRSKHALKLKPYQDSECRVVGYTEGKGKYTGAMGALICAQSVNSTFERQDSKQEQIKDSEIEFKIGTGFNDNMRKNPPKIGSIITYKFQGFTKKGLPRFPSFLRIYSP